MKIAGRKIGPDQPPYIVAEISGNHMGVLDNACELIRMAKACGADSVKIQAYTPDTITLDCDKEDFVIQEGPWKGRKLYELYKKAHTPLEWIPRLFDEAKRADITLFASVFDETALEILECENCPAYKIASMEITDLPLVNAVNKTGKPMIISTGMASSQEIQDASMFTTILNRAYLYCVSGYPTPVEESNLWRLAGTVNANMAVFGISDHTEGLLVPVAATAMGARIIEKHLTMDRNNGSEDAAFSLDPNDFRNMVESVRLTWMACQKSEAQSEESSRQLRRSLYVTQDMKIGERFTHDNVRSIRPSYGLPPKMLDSILGQLASCDIERGTALTHGHISSEEWHRMWEEPFYKAKDPNHEPQSS